jgi:hypothetical protein
MMNISSSEANICNEKQKSLLNDIKGDLDLKAAISRIVGWRAFSYGLSYSIVDSSCRLVIAVGSFL